MNELTQHVQIYLPELSEVGSDGCPFLLQDHQTVVYRMLDVRRVYFEAGRRVQHQGCRRPHSRVAATSYCLTVDVRDRYRRLRVPWFPSARLLLTALAL